MKPNILITLAAMVALLPVLSFTSHAQEQLLFRVDIPFEFIAAGLHMPAGQYLAFHTTPAIIQFVRQDGRASVWIPVKPSPVVSESTSNQLVFNRYGNTYFLAQVKTGHDQQIHECFKCRGEQELATKFSGSGVKTVALNTK